MKAFRSLVSLILAAAVVLIAAALAGFVGVLAGVLPRPAPGAVFGTGIVLDAPPFENVVADGVATCRLDNVIGRTIDRVILQLGGGALTKAMLTNVRLLANDKPIFEDAGSRIDDRMEYRGLTANAAFLSLDFSEIRAHSDLNKYAGAVDTMASGIRKLVLEVTIAGATTPTLAAQIRCARSPQTTNARYNSLIAKVRNFTINLGAAAEHIIPMAFARHPNAFIKRVHLHGSTVTAARVKKTTVPAAAGQNPVTDEIFKRTDAQNDFEMTEFQRVPQANVFPIDFMPDGNVLDALPLGDAQAMEWYATVSGAGNVVVVTETLEPLGNQ